MRKSVIISGALIVLAILIGIILYPRMPDEIAYHWNFRGQADGYIDSFWGLFMMPMLALVLYLFLITIPKIDPLKQNIEEFRSHYDGLMIVFVSFLLYIHLVVIFWNLNMKISMVQMLAPAFAVLFFYIGILTDNAKRNWFVGIRTPWTLSDDRVWAKTHKLGAKLFKAAGIISLAGIFFPRWALIFSLIPVLLVVVYTNAYSYYVYQKLEKKKK